MINDVVVGSVGKMTVQGWHANVEVSIRPDVVVPENAVASVGQTSLLGSMHLQLNPPIGEPPRGRLQPGATIPLSKSSTYPSTEQTLSLLSLVINAGGLAQLGDIVHNFNASVHGREQQIRDLLTRLDTFVGVLDQQRDNIIASIQALNRLAGTFAAQRDALTEALNKVPPGTGRARQGAAEDHDGTGETRHVQRHRHPAGQRQPGRPGEEPAESRTHAAGAGRPRTRIWLQRWRTSRFTPTARTSSTAAPRRLHEPVRRVGPVQRTAEADPAARHPLGATGHGVAGGTGRAVLHQGYV